MVAAWKKIVVSGYQEDLRGKIAIPANVFMTLRYCQGKNLSINGIWLV